MIDVRLTQGQNGRFDLSIDGGDFESVDGFDTALQVSLLSDARADSSEVLTPEQRRGWIGDLVSTVTDRLFGGKLWLLDQRKLTQTTLNDATDFARKALSWFTQDGIAKNIDVSGVIVPRSGIALNIKITSFDGSTENHYVPLWEATGGS